MRIRQSGRAQELRNAPIDGTDAFLLTRLVDTLSVDELLELAPCSPAETLRRIGALAELGLVNLLGPGGEPRLLMVHRPEVDAAEEAVTLRPPRPAAPDYPEPTTLWPTQQAPLQLDLNDFAEPPPTGVRLRPELSVQTLGQVRMIRRQR